MLDSTRGAPIRMAGFAVTCAAAILLEIAPLGLSAGASPSPDLLAAAVFFWALRRPDAAPIVLVCAIAMLRDLLAGGPVGAGALALVLGAESLRSRNGAHMALHLELASFALFALLTGLGAWLMVWITAGGAPALTEVLARAGLSALCYPAVYLLLRSLLRVRSRESAERRASGGAW